VADDADRLALARWRLVLGRFSERRLGACTGGGPGQGQGDGGGSGRDRRGGRGVGGGSRYERMDRVLDYLYGREYAGRGVRGDRSREGTGGSEDSVLEVPDWLKDVRELFPRETVEVIERHALERYGLTELVTDEETLRKMEPSYELLKAVLSFRHLMAPNVLEVARRLVRQVVEDLKRRLAKDVRRAFWGRLNRRKRSPLKVARNLDWHRTIRANLKNYDRERKRLIVESLHFWSRVEHHIPWHIIMAVDCSGSMMDSVIHSAVMAGIFKGLPAVRVSLVAFDTAVVDLTEHADDPTAVLMSVQLGGGTDIAGALGYCETLVTSPTRTILVLVTDFYEGGPPDRFVAAVKRLREAGVRVLGLAALDADANPAYDRSMAEQCAAVGAEVAALTPRRLAEWMAQVIS
jgi:Mg-chelatase subunit ChlD